MQQAIKAKKEETVNLKQTFTSRQDELGHIDFEIDRVTERFHMAQGEMEDMGDVIHREREDLMDRIRELTREIRLKHLIID
jgi:hypothetical protein